MNAPEISLHDLLSRIESAESLAFAETVVATGVLPEMRRQISEAEEARQVANHQTVRRIFEWWTTDDAYRRLHHAMTERTHRIQPLYVDQVRAGFAGLVRLEHVDANNQLASRVDDLALIERRINESSVLWEQLSESTLPPFTITGESIYFPAENAQDWARTYQLGGMQEFADQAIDQALIELNTVKASLNDENRGMLQEPDDILRDYQYDLYIQKKRYLGAVSAEGVLRARRGRVNRDLDELVTGLRIFEECYKYEPNPHRMATLAGWTLSAAVNKEFPGSIMRRIEGILRGSAGILRAFVRDPRGTTNAVRQFMRR